METWMIISLYILQTFTGAIIWRYIIPKDEDSTEFLLFASAFVLPNIILSVVGLFYSIRYIYLRSCSCIDFLAGKKIKKEGIKCTGNNCNGCYLDSCGQNCGCEGI